MTRELHAPEDARLVLRSTTTAQLAQRMLAASKAIAEHLPSSFFAAPALEILLALHIAEEDAIYPSMTEITAKGVDLGAVNDRWMKALIHFGLVEELNGLYALSTAGHAKICDLIEAVFVAQRSLD